MARDVLSVPITTVASESAFSTGGRVIGKFQSSILPANAEAKLCTRDWICGQEDLDGFGSDSDEDEIIVDLQPYVEKLKDDISLDVLFVDTKRGNKIVAFHLKNPYAKLTVLYSHGNAADMGQLWSLHFKGHSTIASS